MNEKKNIKMLVSNFYPFIVNGPFSSISSYIKQIFHSDGAIAIGEHMCHINH